MSRIVLRIGLLAITALAAAPADGQELPPSVGNAPIRTSHPTLRARLEAIDRRSPTWRDALERVRATGRHVLVVTPDQVVVKDTPESASAEPFDPGVLAAVAPLPEPDSRVQVVLVVVNLPLIERAHRRQFLPPIRLIQDLERILVHEVYGHAVPYLLAGDLSGRCPDPAPGQEASEACSIRRENAVRAELRLGRRTGYGLDGLMLASASSF